MRIVEERIRLGRARLPSQVEHEPVRMVKRGEPIADAAGEAEAEGEDAFEDARRFHLSEHGESGCERRLVRDVEPIHAVQGDLQERAAFETDGEPAAIRVHGPDPSGVPAGKAACELPYNPRVRHAATLDDFAALLRHD